MKKIIFFLTAAFFCLLAGGQETLAAAETVVAELDTDRQECIFEIRWEEEEAQAQIRITSPGGEVYGTEETPDSVTAMQGCAYFYIGEAQAGDWQVEITGEKLGEVEVNVGSLPQSMQILSFTVAENGRGGYDASWNISDCPENAEIAVYADTDNRGYDGQLIASGGSGPEGTLSFQMASLDSGYYYFYLTVTETGGIFNYQYGDTALFYDNTGGRNKLENTEASLLNRDVYVSWKGEENRTYRVMLFDPDTKLLLTSRETEETSCVLPMPEGYARILAAAADYTDGRTGRFDVYAVSLDQAVEASVTYPEETVTSQPVIFASVNWSGSCTVSATLNEELLMERETAQGQYEIHLEEGDNTIVFLVTDEKGNTATYRKDISLDTSPPQLSVRRNLDQVTTDDSYVYVEGYTEAGVRLTCNGEPVELVGNYFSYRQALSYGKNEILLTATDAAGNEARYSAEVTRPFWSAGIVKWILLGILAAGLTATEIVLLIRAKRRSRK